MLWRKQRSQCYVDMVHHRARFSLSLPVGVIVQKKKKQEEVKIDGRSSGRAKKLSLI